MSEPIEIEVAITGTLIVLQCECGGRFIFTGSRLVLENMFEYRCDKCGAKTKAPKKYPIIKKEPCE